MLVTGLDGNNLSINVLSLTGSAMEVAEQGEHAHLLARIAPNSFANDILGLWEGVEMTGFETYVNAEASIEYHADGTYAYYSKLDGKWVKSANVDNEYNLDGDWLAHRWRPAEGQGFNYEWWDIEYITNGEMKWSAIREKEDGSRFNTTFTWKKVPHDFESCP